MTQAIETNQEIKCTNPTAEKVVVAGFCLAPVSPPSLKLPDWFRYTGTSQRGAWVWRTGNLRCLPGRKGGAQRRLPNESGVRGGRPWRGLRGAGICTHPCVGGHPPVQPRPSPVQMGEVPGQGWGRPGGVVAPLEQEDRGPWSRNSTKEKHYVERLFYFLIMMMWLEWLLKCIYF